MHNKALHLEHLQSHSVASSSKMNDVRKSDLKNVLKVSEWMGCNMTDSKYFQLQIKLAWCASTHNSG